MSACLLLILRACAHVVRAIFGNRKKERRTAFATDDMNVFAGTNLQLHLFAEGADSILGFCHFNRHLLFSQNAAPSGRRSTWTGERAVPGEGQSCERRRPCLTGQVEIALKLLAILGRKANKCLYCHYRISRPRCQAFERGYFGKAENFLIPKRDL